MDEEDLDDGYEEEELDEESYYNDLDEDAIATDIPPRWDQSHDKLIGFRQTILKIKSNILSKKDVLKSNNTYCIIYYSASIAVLLYWNSFTDVFVYVYSDSIDIWIDSRAISSLL